MSDYIKKQCPKCGQQLRFPANIGGMLMACPSCGKKFHSDFKLGGVKRSSPRGQLAKIFGMPSEIMRCISRFFSS